MGGKGKKKGYSAFDAWKNAGGKSSQGKQQSAARKTAAKNRNSKKIQSHGAKSPRSQRQR